MSGKTERRVLADQETLAGEAAAWTAKRLTENSGGDVRVVLAGGSTPKRLYQVLAEEPYVRRIDWSRVHFFWGDERSVGPEHPESNYRMAYEALLSRIDIPERNIHRMRGEAGDLPSAALDYEEEIRRHFDVRRGSPPPRFDVVLLGMGTDGHTASLFPGTCALTEKDRWVVANAVPRLGTDRLTMTTVLLNRAAEILFLVSGGDKAETLAEVLDGPLRPEALPAQLIRPTSGRCFWWVDQSAAARLRDRAVNKE